MASHAMHSDELAKALASGYEEAVEVNQRGLVEKLLARYSGEHTVFRELAQNADDALANSIEIHFDTEREVPLGSLRTEPIQRITIKNDGIVFREEDWRRLKTIADGQPNEESIGAFGVGFYSIWSLSDQPLVVSGSEAMEFRWRGQQLVVRRAKNPSQEGELAPNGRPWSSITMPCRDREPMPDPASFSKFLSTALPFTQNIRSMSVFFNKHQLLALDKLPAPPRTLAIPQYTSIRSPQRLMSITAVESTPVQMTCKVMRIAVTSPGQPSAKKASAQPAKQSFATKFLSFASAQRQPETEVKEVVPAKDPAEVLSSALSLSIVTASTRISAPADFIAEFSRSTKKAPPAQTRLKILFTSKDEVDASSLDKSSKDAQSIFSGLISGSGQQGRIYIGFPLFQTTGMECAVSAKLIPTVEREQIDLNSRALADYNRELLALAGITSRIVYDSEMGEIMSKLIKLGSAGEGAAEDPARTWLLQQASHLMKSFTYHDSTPIGSISRLIQTSFFSCNTREFLVASSRGILPSTKVRLPATELTFLAGLAVIPDDIAKENTLLLDHLQQRDLISSVTIDDVVKQLNEKALTTTQAISAIQWWIGLSHNSLYDSSLLNSFRNALIMSIAADDDAGVEKVVPLSSIKYFLNPRTIPPDMPLPPSVLPHQVARATSQTDLQRTFAFVELSMAEWTRYIVSKEMLGGVDTSITLSAVFAERFLNVLAKVWPNLRPAESSQIVSLLEPIACIPTKKGMHKPAESYLPKVDLFEDLPVTTLAVKGNLERLLKSLGVRTHVDLQLVFSRLLGGGEWDQEQVAKYLVSVNNSLTSDEKDRLGKTAWLTIESKTDLGEGQKPTRYKARTVYEPNDSLRELGLPIIAWKGNWRRHSEEAKLLYSMGLQKGPAVEAILAFAADMSDTERQKKALAYFLSNYDQQYATSYQPSKQNFPFVPVLHGGNATFAKPQEAYTSVGSQVLGFPMLHPDYQLQAAKFKLAADPSAKALVGALLAKPPATPQMATPIFAYLATQAARAWTRMRPLVKLTVAMLTSIQAGFSAAEHNDLAFQRFIPAQAEEDGPFNLYSPKSVFFQSAESALATEFRSLFVFVNYGTAANAFLLQVGVRAEPTITEITALLLADPKRFLTLAGSSDKYISLLRQIASSYSALPVATKKRMLSAPFILGYERLHTDSSADKKGKQTDADDDEDDDVLLSYRLALPGEVVVIDDTTFLADFRDNLLTCPQDDLVEAFCEQLGSKRISKLVSVNYSSTTVPENASPRAASIRKLVLERVTLFLHERQQSSSGKDIRYSDDWLKNNLQVREVTRIERQRTLTLGQSRFVKTSVASAAATIEKGKGALLRISSNLNDLDYYEVAAALTPIVLSKQRIHDSLLLMTLLQTSLRDLKRRGFNVDKIMSQRKAEQDAIERQQREERAAGDLKRIKEQELQKALPPAYGDDDGRFSMDEKRSLVGDGSSPPPPQPARSLFDNLRSKLKGNDPLVPPKSPHMAIESAAGESSGGPPRDRAIAGRGPQEPQGPQVTPTSSIATNVLRAVQASRPDRSGNITADVNTEDVKESNSNYCDSAPANNLDFVTEIASVRFYISRDIDADENILQKHSMALRRFVQDIVLPVGAVYNVEPKALHVFYDGSGPLIAFNRSGSLFFNLRFHLAWYGEQVKGGFLSDALISTYFSMAHELAHNLVLPHNAEHAFYTSAIAQQYFLPLAGYIAELDSNRSAPLQLTQH